jgi:hypothetical protein
MDLDKMTTEEVQALLRLLVDLETEDLALLLQERREAERRRGGCIDARKENGDLKAAAIMSCLGRKPAVL